MSAKPKPKPASKSAKPPKSAKLKFESAKPLPLNPFAQPPEFPQWFHQQYPGYVAAAHSHVPGGQTVSLREANHGGHTIKVTTTYAVEVDGAPISLHLMVDDEGMLWSHMCPYHTFSSALDLIRFIIDQLPEAFGQSSGENNNHGGHDHGEHSHHTPLA
jgi:hypothetical protein